VTVVNTWITTHLPISVGWMAEFHIARQPKASLVDRYNTHYTSISMPYQNKTTKWKKIQTAR